MKKTLLFVSAMLLAACQICSAQTLNLLENMQVSRKSNDGKIVVSTDASGCMTVQNMESGEILYFEPTDDQQRYAVGFGNIFDDEGNMVGNIDDATPAILKNGEWTALPVAEGDNVSGKLNSADGITPDGKRICGGIARSSFGLDSDDVMMAPVIWEKGDDGNYGMYKVLPYPEKDFTGRIPQYVTARSISADGKTVIGQIVDYSGSFPMPVVYREGDDGKWTYEILGAELVYNTEAVWPEYPEKEPERPDATLYMDEEKAKEYAAAYAKYQEDLELYWEGKLDEYPAQPFVEDYVTDTEGYNKAMEEYQGEYNKYMQAIQDFDNLFWDFSVVYGRSFDFNSVFMSSDGRYMAAMYAQESDDPNVDPMEGKQDFRVVRFDLQADGNPYETCEALDGLPTYVMDDGTVMYATPMQESARETYLWPLGTTEVTPLYGYMLMKYPEASVLMEENLTFNKVKQGPMGMQMKGEKVTTSGTAVASGDGTVFIGWLYNAFYKAGNWEVMSYVLDTKSADGIKFVDETESRVVSLVVTAANGMQLYSGADTSAARKAMVQGINVMTLTMANGKTKTIKVIKK